MVTDPIADLLTRIRNAQTAGHTSTRIPASNLRRHVLELLVEEGYIAGVEDAESATGKPEYKAMLRYDETGQPAIREMKRLSRPGRRQYVGKDDIPRNRGGLGVVLVSTSKGVLSDHRARKEGVGGELLCSVF